MQKPLAYSLAALLGAAGMSAALAQPAPEPGAAPAPRTENRAFTRPTERVEARLAYIKTALKITPAQQAQWDAYASAVRKDAQRMDERMQNWRQQRAEHGARPNAIQRLERLQAFHTEQANRVGELLTVEKPLYAALSPEQQAVADRVLMPGGRGEQRGGRMHAFRRG